MAIELPEAIECILYNYMTAIIYRDYAYEELVEAGDCLIAGNTYTAGWRLKDAAYWLRAIHLEFSTHNTRVDPPYLMPYVLKELEEREIEITWKSICEAWVKNDFEGRFWTIGIIDRMRQIMWDEPFDLTWAAKPEERKIPSE